MLRYTAFLLPVIIISLAAAGPAECLGYLSKFRDPDDGAFDLSASMATSYGFLPVVKPITDPAVGYGAVGALAFMHRPKGWDIEEARAAFDARERLTEPSMSAVYGMYTSSESWGAGAAHLGVWGSGRWRYTGAFAVMDLNLSIVGEGESGQDRLFDYGFEGWTIIQNLRYRIGASNWWVGAMFYYLQTTTEFTGDQIRDIDPQELDANLGNLGVGLRFDNRSNTFTPDRGILADLSVRRFAEWIGSDFEYWSAKGTLLGYIDPTEKVVIGLRAEGKATGDSAPFWARSSINIRGIARNQYFGDLAGVFEGEVRLDVTNRWSLMGFGGTGWLMTDDDESGVDQWLGSGGAGFRYLLARAFGMRGGIDGAYSSDGWAFYITVGNAWAGF